jgi:hypothetical protein
MPKGKSVSAEDAISQEDVIGSGLIPNLDPMHLSFVGKDWWKDGVSGMSYHFIRNEDKTVSIKETRQSKSKVNPVTREPAAPKVAAIPKEKTAIIKCVDCGAEREVKVQDVFQVKRCITCQTKHRNARRKENAAVRKAAAPAPQPAP